MKGAGKSSRYKMKHSGAGKGSAQFGSNVERSASRPPFATHGSAAGAGGVPSVKLGGTAGGKQADR